MWVFLFYQIKTSLNSTVLVKLNTVLVCLSTINSGLFKVNPQFTEYDVKVFHPCKLFFGWCWRLISFLLLCCFTSLLSWSRSSWITSVLYLLSLKLASTNLRDAVSTPSSVPAFNSGCGTRVSRAPSQSPLVWSKINPQFLPRIYFWRYLRISGHILACKFLLFKEARFTPQSVRFQETCHIVAPLSRFVSVQDGRYGE